MLSPTASTAYLVRNHAQKDLRSVDEGSADLRRVHDRFLTTYYYTVLFLFMFDICSIYNSAGEPGELRVLAWLLDTPSWWFRANFSVGEKGTALK